MLSKKKKKHTHTHTLAIAHWLLLESLWFHESSLVVLEHHCLNPVRTYIVGIGDEQCLDVGLLECRRHSLDGEVGLLPAAEHQQAHGASPLGNDEETTRMHRTLQHETMCLNSCL